MERSELLENQLESSIVPENDFFGLKKFERIELSFKKKDKILRVGKVFHESRSIRVIRGFGS